MSDMAEIEGDDEGEIDSGHRGRRRRDDVGLKCLFAVLYSRDGKKTKYISPGFATNKSMNTSLQKTSNKGPVSTQQVQQIRRHHLPTQIIYIKHLSNPLHWNSKGDTSRHLNPSSAPVERLSLTDWTLLLRYHFVRLQDMESTAHCRTGRSEPTQKDSLPTFPPNQGSRKPLPMHSETPRENPSSVNRQNRETQIHDEKARNSEK